jgi:colicin import membrane protein
LRPKREQAAATEAARLAEQREAFEVRKAAGEAAKQRADEAARRKAAHEEAKQKAKLKQQSEAKRAAKHEKKAQKKAPSAFKLQEEQERQAAAERAAEEQKAAELEAELVLKREAIENQRQALQAAQQARHRHQQQEAEQRAVQQHRMRLTTEQSLAAEQSEAEISDVLASLQEVAAAPRMEMPETNDQLLQTLAQPANTRSAAAESADMSHEEERLCIVCLEGPRTHMVFPCGHRCLCKACAVLIDELCPMCRAPKVGMCEVFL